MPGGKRPLPRLLPLLIGMAVLAGLAIAGRAAVPAKFLRESRTVAIAGRQEIWQLVWEGRPKPICGPDEVEMAITCPCSGWAYGEYGNLTLQRVRGGKTIDSMALGPLFGDALPVSGASNFAAMQWRPFEHRDMDEIDGDGAALPGLLARIRARPGPRAMLLGDYDHDGSASEFLVQVSAGPCGHTEYVAVGISKSRPKLHALGTARSPGRAFSMAGSAWQALLTAPRESRVTVWPCGDHASEERHELVLSAKAGAIRATRRRYSCPEHGSREVLLGSEEL